MIDDEGAALGAKAAERLARLDTVTLRPGLSEDEFMIIEERYGFEFADDHRYFLSAGLPVGRGWPDWRDGEEDVLRDRLDWPTDGVLYDVEHNMFWTDSWGHRPSHVAEAVAVAGQQLATVPVMVPVFGHRYLPAGRGTYGHPVLSMYQSDIIVYGLDLDDYIRQEFGGAGMRRDDPRWRPRISVPFWKDLIE